MALTNDANTPEREGALVSRPVEAATQLFAGSIGAINAAGNIVPASNVAGLKVIGRVESHIDNLTGLAGAENVTLKRGVFRFANSVASPLTAADILVNAVIEDDGTVAKTILNAITAGKVIDIDAGGVWIEIK